MAKKTGQNGKKTGQTGKKTGPNAPGQVAPAAEPGKARWTVMVFMGADTEDGNFPMYDAAAADLAEMAAVGSNDDLTIIVQVHARGNVRRAVITHEMFDDIRKRGLDAVPIVDQPAGDAFKEFMEWAIKKADHKPDLPEHYSMLVLWGHAYDFAIGHTPTVAGQVDALDFVEITSLLREIQAELQQKLGTQRPPKLDVIAFDACDVATAELALELEPFGDYLLASQIGVPIPGWPYDKVFERLRSAQNPAMSPTQLGTWIINRYCETYSDRGEVSLSMLDLKRAAELYAYVRVFSEALDTAIADEPESVDFVAEIFSRSMTEAGKPYVDLADLCLGLARESDAPFVAAAARALGDFLIAPPRDAQASAEAGTGLSFVTASGRVGGETAKLNGISLYAPHVAPDYDFVGVRRRYERFDLARSTRWSKVIHVLAASDASGLILEDGDAE